MSDFYPPQPLRNAVEDQVGGGTPPRSNPAYWSGPIPWVSVKDFEESGNRICDAQEHISLAGLNACSSKLIPENTPLICTRMAVGRSALAQTAVAINQDVKALFPKAGYSASYLLRILQFIRPVAEAKSVGSTVKGIRIQDYLDIAAHLAPPEAQTFIARILDTLDTAIQQTEAILEKLKAVKQGLLHDLLTRGIDANGQLRLPQTEAPHLYKESPLGWIPKEWECNEFGNLAEYVNGNTFDAREWSVNGLPIIRIQNLNGSSTFNYYTGKVEDAWHVFPGDLLFAWSGQRGISFGARIWPGPEGVLNQHIFKVLPKVQLVSKAYLFRLLRFRQNAIEDSAHGFKDSFLHVTRGELEDVLVGVPVLDEQRQIETRIAAFERQFDKESSEYKKLMNLKVALMDDLLTGRVRVTPLLEKAA